MPFHVQGVQAAVIVLMQAVLAELKWLAVQELGVQKPSLFNLSPKILKFYINFESFRIQNLCKISKLTLSFSKSKTNE